MVAISKNDFKIIYFHLSSQNEDEEYPKGCVVIHKPTGFSGFGEEGVTAEDNLTEAFKKVALLAKIPPDKIADLFSCPTCGQPKLPKIEKWDSNHDYAYSREFTGNDHPSCPDTVKFSPTPLCTAVVYRNNKDIYWYWDVDPNLNNTAKEDADSPLGFSHFLEDAIEAAEKYAIEVVKKSIKADELEPRE